MAEKSTPNAKNSQETNNKNKDFIDDIPTLAKKYVNIKLEKNIDYFDN
jgi:hypothetical protein